MLVLSLIECPILERNSACVKAKLKKGKLASVSNLDPSTPSVGHSNESMKVYSFLSLILTLFFYQITFGQTADMVDGCAPLTVNFTAPSTGGTHYWEFKDGATSTLQNPTNTFLNPGSYTVEYRQTVGGPVIGTVTIDVFAKPVPTFTADVTRGCAPLSVNFSNTTSLSPSININSLSWVFNDGGTAVGSNPNYRFNTAGSFSVSLEIITNLPSCDAAQLYPNAIVTSDRPNVEFTTNPDPPSACVAPLNVSFANNTTSASGPLTYSWKFGEGTTSTDETPASVDYTADGDYPVVLIATDTNGCSDSVGRGVSIGSPTASFYLKNFPDTICLGIEDTIVNESSFGFYDWNFGVNGNPQTSFRREPIISFTQAGINTITFEVTAPGGCKDDTTINVLVEEAIAEFTSNPTYSCTFPAQVDFTSTSTGAESFKWTFGNDSTSELENPSIIYEKDDTTLFSVNGANYYHTKLTVTSAFGCIDSIVQTDTVHEPNAFMMPDVVDGCVPLTVTFSDSSSFDEEKPMPIVRWEWVFGDGNSTVNTTGNPESNTYSTIGEYDAYLIVTNSAGCIDTSYLTRIKVGDKINPDFTIDLNTVCVGDTVRFNDITAAPLGDSIDAWHFATEEDRMFSCFGDPAPAWSFFDKVGMHDVTMTVGFNGCFSSVTKSNSIQVNGPIAKIYYDKECSQPYDVQFIDTSQNGVALEWDFGDGSGSAAEDPFHTYASSGDYIVKLKASDLASGCADSRDSLTVFIRDVKANIFSDSVLCQGVEYPFGASLSVDEVDDGCQQPYTWLFDDPDIRPQTTPLSTELFTFPNRGNTFISLVAKDINGCLDTVRKSLRIYGVDADFTISDDTICAPTLVEFGQISTADTTIVSWAWDLGDDSSLFFKQKQDFNHSYLDFRDPLELELIVRDTLGCADTIMKNIRMYEPSSIVTLTDNAICSGTTIDFTASDFTAQGSNLTFNWDFDDGTTSTQQNPSHTYTEGGAYITTLDIEEISTGCKNQITRRVDVRDYPIAGYTTSEDPSKIFCPNNNVLFTDTSIVSAAFITYQWDFGNGSTSVFQNPGTIYQTNGNYDIEFIVTIPAPFGCADTSRRTVQVRGPIGDFSTDLNGDTICRLESVVFTIKDTADVDNYQWDFGDGGSLSNISPVSHQYTFVPPSGQTIAKLIMSNADGSCPETRDTVINIYEVVADFQRNDGIDTAFCFAPYPITTQSINADEWYWDFGDGTTSTDENPSIIQYAEAGNYKVTLGVKNNQLECTDTIVKDVILHPIPEIEAFGDTICEGIVANIGIINPNNFWTYNWTSNPTAPITNPNAAITTTQPNITTEYSATVLDTNECTNSDMTSVFVLNPLLLEDFDTIIVVGDRIELPVYVNAGLYNWVWTPEEGLSCLDCSPPTVQPLEDIEYNLVLSDILGCFVDNVDFNIKVHPETFISMPTSFTPNGDGNNDLIFVEGWGIKDLFEYQIYNRWGELVFETSNLEVGWDGKYKGEIQNNDVYVYKVRVRTWRDEEKTQEGYINLIR